MKSRRALRIGSLICFTLLATACADPAAEKARLDAADHQNCIDLGFKPGTEAYGNCRLKMKEIRAKNEGSQSPNVSLGLGVGVAHGF